MKNIQENATNGSLKNTEIDYLNKKIKNLKIQIAYTEGLNAIEKKSLEIDLEDFLIKKFRLENDVDNALLHKKTKLKKEIEYIELIESEKALKTITLGAFLQKEYKDIEFIRTDIKAFDDYLKNEEDITGGLPIGAMIQFAARSAAGKTSTLMRLALNITKNGEKVAHINYEMSEMLLHKSYTKIISGNYSYFEKSMENLILPENPSNRLEDLIRDIKLLHYRQGIRVFIVDSRMKIRVDNARNSKEAATEISHELSELVRTLGVTIILINQLSEEAIKDNRIVLKESGDQEYDADLVLGLGFVYEKDENGKVIPDENTKQPKVKEDRRLLICKKTRFDNLPYSAEILMNEIFLPRVVEVSPNINDNDLNVENISKPNEVKGKEQTKEELVNEIVNDINKKEDIKEIKSFDELNIDDINIPW